MQPEPFSVEVSESVLSDLRDRLLRTRIAPDPDNENWRFGVNGDYLRSFIDYWANEYRWDETQERLNSFPNYRVTIDGQAVHFIHVRGRGPRPLPLILTHGYPWSYWDYRKVIAPLADPVAHGGDAEDAFDVVVPSVPGYCFSSPMRAGGISARQTAGLWVELMRSVLGYGKFGTAGGDWGAVISIMLGYEHANDLVGLYVTLPNFGPALRNRFEPFDPESLGTEERVWYDREWRRKPRPGASTLPATAPNFRTPQTQAYPGFDSPLALATAIIESRHRAGDTGGNVESVFTREELVTNAMLYWVTDSWPSAHRYYWYTVRDPVEIKEERTPLIDVPTGLGAFPAEAFYVPRKVVERYANVTHWSFLDKGGHFAACEQPDTFVAELRSFFRPLR